MFEFATQFGIDTSIDRWNTRSAKDMTAMVCSSTFLVFPLPLLTIPSSGVRQALWMTLKTGILAAYTTLPTCKFGFLSLASYQVHLAHYFIVRFSGATSFNQDLCDWRSLVRTDATTRSMFAGSQCLDTRDPSAGGSWCRPCSRRLRNAW